MTEHDFDSRPIRIEARRRPRAFDCSQPKRFPARSPCRPLHDATSTDRLPPGNPYYCSWDLESCLRYWM